MVETTNLESAAPQDMFLEQMGSELGRLYYAILQEYHDIKCTWDQFEWLFGANQEKVELLNRAGGQFFYNVDRIFFEYVILGICRIMDKAEDGSYTNLSLHQFKKFTRNETERDTVEKIIGKIEETMKVHRDWRNKKISHNDFDIILKNRRLYPQSRYLINRTLSEVKSLISYFNNLYLGYEFEEPINPRDSDHHNMVISFYIAEIEAKSLKKDRQYHQKYGFRQLPSWLLAEPVFKK